MEHSRKPIACSLELREAANQALEWRDLQSHALASESIEHGIAVIYPLAVAETLGDLVSRESACCSWLHLELIPGDEIVRLEFRSDHPDAASVIAAIAGVG